MGRFDGIKEAVKNDPVGKADQAKDVAGLAKDVADAGIADVHNQKLEAAKAKAGALLDIYGILGGGRVMSGASIDAAKGGVNGAIDALGNQEKRLEERMKDAGVPSDEVPSLPPESDPEGAGGDDDGGAPQKPGKGGAAPAVAGTTPPRRDPLVLDLDGDGIETSSPADGTIILFDHDADGVQSSTGWVKPDDGWLVLDRDENGTIDTGRELFGVDTIKSDGTNAVDGFDALRDLDENGDGLFNASDSKFHEVEIWRDINQDGVSQQDELTSLDAAGIVSIGVNGANIRSDLGNGNIQTAVGTFTRTGGAAGSMGTTSSTAANLDLLVNTFYREYTDEIEISERAAALPVTCSPRIVRN